MREGWELKRLGDLLIFDKRFNGVPKEQQKAIAHFKHVSAEELRTLKVDEGTVRLISTGQFDGYTTEELAGSNLNSGEIVTIPTGGVANVKYYKGSFVDSGNLIGIVKQKSNSLKYIYYGMICKKDEINSYYRGVSIKHPFMPDICKITIPVPPIQEQEKIVAELDCLLSVIGKKKKQLIELEKLSQTAFYEMFGDPIENEKGWEVLKLGSACRHITDGDHMPPPKSEDGIPFITISNIDKDYREIDFSDTFFVPQQYFDCLKEERKAREGDLLYTVTGSYGIPVIVKGKRPFCFQRHIALLRPNNEILQTVFLCYWALCGSIKQMADSVATGIAQKTVGLNSIRNFPIILPQ